MITVTMPKLDTTITIWVDPTKVAKGHQSHRSGSGRHGDRRTKRQRTRSQQKRTISNDSGD